MYKFACSATSEHVSYSASKEQRDPSCPTCGAPTKLVLSKAQIMDEMIFRIRSDRTGNVVVDLAHFENAVQWVDETRAPIERESYLLSFEVGEMRRSGEFMIERTN